MNDIAVATATDRARVQAQRTVHAGQLAIGLFLVMLICIGVSVGLYTHQQADRAHDACDSRARLYAGQEFITQFFGNEVHATETQIDKALADLREKLGKRPAC